MMIFPHSRLGPPARAQTRLLERRFTRDLRWTCRMLLACSARGFAEGAGDLLGGLGAARNGRVPLLTAWWQQGAAGSDARIGTA